METNDIMITATWVMTFVIYGICWFGVTAIRKILKNQESLKLNQQLSSEKIKGSELIFISHIRRSGLSVSEFDNDVPSLLNSEEFILNPLSLTKKTYIASGFNSYVVKLKNK